VKTKAGKATIVEVKEKKQEKKKEKTIKVKNIAKK